MAVLSSARLFPGGDLSSTTGVPAKFLNRCIQFGSILKNKLLLVFSGSHVLRLHHHAAEGAAATSDNKSSITHDA